MHILGDALGVARDGPSDCGVCGASPFAAGRPALEVFGPLFVDYDLVHDPTAESVCAACVAVLGGKPSRENPPVRMGHFAVVGGMLERPDGARLLDLLRDPSGVQVIGWTRTRQKHASLRARVCRPGDAWVATEDVAVRWDPAHNDLVDAVSLLRSAATGDHIASGSYPPHVIAALGASWAPAEEVVARHRPSVQLDIACALVRRPTATLEHPPMPTDPNMTAAARLLLLVTHASPYRAPTRAIEFWGSLLHKRLATASRRDSLPVAVGKLMELLSVHPTAGSTRAAWEQVESLSAEEAASVLREWRDRPRIIVTIARALAAHDQES